MEKSSVLTLNIDGDTINDCQLWSTDKIGLKPILNNDQNVNQNEFVSYINYHLIPVFLFKTNSYTVYSDDEKTNTYFQNNLVKHNLYHNFNIGLLFKANDDLYSIFHLDSNNLIVKCRFISFNILKLDAGSSENDRNCFVDHKTSTLSSIQIQKSNSSISNDRFNKVLFNKRNEQSKKSSPFLAASTKSSPQTTSSSSLSSLTLTNHDQITQAVNKLILSGLRIRGLSTKSNDISSNEKITIKEIYQMTRKSTLFALRKFNYTFNDQTNVEKNYSIKLNDIQNIVEQLLEVFIDMEHK